MSAAIANANRSPTSSFSIISPATASGSVGMFWPCVAMPVRPIASATATMPLTCPGICLAENNGASTNSGLTRASTRKKAVTDWPPPSAVSTWLSVSWFIRSATGSTCTGSGRT